MKTADRNIQLPSGIRLAPGMPYLSKLFYTLKLRVRQFNMAHTFGQFCSSQLGWIENFG
jgi:hypothetical protein